MATPTSYSKTISTDFLNGKVDSTSLAKEIMASSISIAFSHINTDDNTCDIWFKDAISTGEETTLATICSNHTGERVATITQTVKIQEESIETGGHFAASTINITAGPSATVSQDIWWPYDISALIVKFKSNGTQTGDTIDMCIGKDTHIGSITSDISSLAPTWTSQNYIAGDKVTYNHPDFGNLVYTCMVTTISNENPTDKSYWRHGFQIYVDQTSIDNSFKGVNITLDDGTNVSEMGKIISKTHDSLFLENAPATTFLTSTPTSVKMTVKVFQDYSVGDSGDHKIGDSKIGGSNILAYTKVCVEYTNNYTSTQTLIGSVEYLY